jgi:hypothetical protein
MDLKSKKNKEKNKINQKNIKNKYENNENKISSIEKIITSNKVNKDEYFNQYKKEKNIDKSKNKNKNKTNSRTNNRNSNNDYDKLKEFSISKKDLNEGRLDNSFRMSKRRKQSVRAIESFNTVNRTNQLQLTYKNTSGNDTPKTQQNFNYSEFDDMKPENDRIKNNNNYEYKYDNVAFRNIDESTFRNNVRAKIYYSNSPNEDNNNQNKYSQNNSDRNKYSDRERDPNNRNMNMNYNNLANNLNFYNNSFSMNGKQGWICTHCKNFNYESKIFILYIL